MASRTPLSSPPLRSWPVRPTGPRRGSPAPPHLPTLPLPRSVDVRAPCHDERVSCVTLDLGTLRHGGTSRARAGEAEALAEPERWDRRGLDVDPLDRHRHHARFVHRHRVRSSRVSIESMTVMVGFSGTRDRERPRSAPADVNPRRAGPHRAHRRRRFDSSPGMVMLRRLVVVKNLGKVAQMTSSRPVAWTPRRRPLLRDELVHPPHLLNAPHHLGRDGRPRGARSSRARAARSDDPSSQRAVPSRWLRPALISILSMAPRHAPGPCLRRPHRLIGARARGPRRCSQPTLTRFSWPARRRPP